MEKKNISEKKSRDCEKTFNDFKKQVESKFQSAKKYAKKNPQKTKTILASLGAFLSVIFAFLMGKNKKNKQDKDQQ